MLVKKKTVKEQIHFERKAVILIFAPVRRMLCKRWQSGLMRRSCLQDSVKKPLTQKVRYSYGNITLFQSTGLFMAFYTYILKSEKTGNYYFGHCNDLEARLSKHNEGKVKSTKGRRPWAIIYYEEFATKSEAFRKEQFFKSLAGRKWLYEKEILKRVE